VKLAQLLEMPIIKQTELDVKPVRPFYSVNTIQRNFDVVYRGRKNDGQEYWCVLRKNLHIASIGLVGQRDDGMHGLDVIGTVEFKPSTMLSGRKEFDIPSNVLQVGLVEIGPRRQSQGWGMRLYTALADVGYTIISDNTQYIGGQALWKRIASATLHNHYKVYIIKDGEPLVDEKGELVTYDGSNIDDARLWSTNSDTKYTLFALRKAL
jgi:hypothetical protein